MSDEMTDGLMIAIGDEVFLIPREDLRTFRAPDDVAAAARTLLDERDEVVGFASTTPDQRTGTPPVQVAGVKFGTNQGPLSFSSIMEHALTVSRVFC